MKKVYLCLIIGALMVSLSFLSMSISFVPIAYAYVNDQPATLAIGQESLTSNVHVPVNASSLYDPVGVAFSHGDMIVVSQNDNRILIYQPPFTMHEQATYVLGQANFTTNGVGNLNASDVENPEAVAVDSAGNVWVTDYSDNRILEFTYPFSNHEAASVIIGAPTFTANVVSNPPTASSLQQPTAIAFDSSGNLWVADTFDNRVLEFAPSSSGLFTSVQDGESASLVLGQSSFTSSFGTEGLTSRVNASDFDHPEGIAFDSSGNLWVSDIGDSRILEFTYPFQTGESASVVLGQSSMTSLATSGVTASSVSAFGIGFDSSGDLWAADIYNNRVLEFVPGTGSCSAGQFCNDMPASIVLGQSSFTTSGSTLSSTGLYQPTVVAFDGSGNLWVADGGYNRVLEFLNSPSTSTTTTTSTTTVTSAATVTQTASTTSTVQQTTTSTSTSLTSTTITTTSTEPVTETTTIPTTISSATCYDPTVTVTSTSTTTVPTTITFTTTATYLTTNTNTETETVTSTATDTTTTVVPVTTTQTSLSSTTECGTTVSTSTSGVPQFPGFGAALVIVVAALLPLVLVLRKLLISNSNLSKAGSRT